MGDALRGGCDAADGEPDLAWAGMEKGFLR
jgi:hypothetical protein